MSLIDHFTPRRVDAGVVKVDQEVAFTIINSSGLEIESFQKSCGCLGTVTILDKKDLNCQLKAQAKGSITEVYQYGDKYIRWFPNMPEGRRFYDVATKSWLRALDAEVTTLTKVLVHEFSQTLTIILKDGNPVQVVDGSGELVDNAAKAKVSIPVNMFVLK